MKKTSYLIVPAALFAVACGDSSPCPSGHRKVGSRCEAIEQEGASTTSLDGGLMGDAGDEDADGLVEQDGAPPETDAAAFEVTCLVDLDGDHFAVSARGALCAQAAPEGTPEGDCDDTDPARFPEALDVCDDSVDNDCDGETDEGVAETCDGVDNDCDGALENGFACDLGGTNLACTTSCGTQGKGACSASCELPTGDACVPPSEVCNLVDDDCDGVVDPDMITRRSEVAFTSGGTGDAKHSAIFTLAVDGQSPWLVYRGIGSVDDGASLRRRRIASGGAVQAEQVVARSDNTTSFWAASDGKWIAILADSRRNESGDALMPNRGSTARLQLYRAADFGFVSELLLATRPDGSSGNNPEEDCDMLWGSSVAVFEDGQGLVQVAAVYGKVDGKPPTEVFCETRSGALNLRTLAWNGTVWQQRTPVPLATISEGSTVLGQPLRGTVVRAPCRNEWLALAVRPGEATLSRRSLTGASVQSVATYPAQGFARIAAASTQCDASDSELLVHYPLANEKSSIVRRLSLNHATGAITQSGDPQAFPDAMLTSSLSLGGRWFLSGLPMVQSGRMPLFELSSEDWGASRDVPLYTVGGAGANPGDLFQANMVYGFLDVNLIALTSTGEQLMVLAANFAGGNLEQYRPAGDTQTPMGVAYRVGCP